MNYYSQIGQDQYYIEHISKGKRNGVYLDIGANDGIFTSNTATLEFEFGWKGICVEANSNLISQLTVNRPNSKIINCAVWNTDGEVEFEIPTANFKKIRGDLLSRISNEELNNRNKKYFKRHFEEAPTEIIKVPSKTITSILKNEYTTFPCTIDYMSLDTEGAELECLQGIDFDIIDIKFMTIEHGNRSGMKEKFIEFLLPHGYRVHRINQWDIEFEK